MRTERHVQMQISTLFNTRPKQRNFHTLDATYVTPVDFLLSYEGWTGAVKGTWFRTSIEKIGDFVFGHVELCYNLKPQHPFQISKIQG